MTTVEKLLIGRLGLQEFLILTNLHGKFDLVLLPERRICLRSLSGLAGWEAKRLG